MDSNFLVFALMALAAAAASPLGGGLSLLIKPSSLTLSLTVGYAGGVLLGAVSFEMLPKALELSDPLLVCGAVCLGVLLVWSFDLYINRGLTAGQKAEQKHRVRRFHRRHKPRGSKVAVIAGATAAEELIEGVVIGVSAAVGSGTGLVVALAIAIDNISEALSIGELARNEEGGGDKRRDVMFWTGLIGLSLAVSAFAGYLLLRGIPPEWQGLLTATGAGAMFYIATGGLVPEADENQFQQSGALATGAGFVTMLVVTQLS